MGKLSGSHSNLSFLKSKFGSCIGLGAATNNDENDENIDNTKIVVVDDSQNTSSKKSKKIDDEETKSVGLVDIGRLY